MVSRESVNEVFLPDKEDCLEYLRDHRWPDGATCPHCESADTIKKGTTRKGAQRYQCENCNSSTSEVQRNGSGSTTRFSVSMLAGSGNSWSQWQSKPTIRSIEM